MLVILFTFPFPQFYGRKMPNANANADPELTNAKILPLGDTFFPLL
jgi:hypothetical protein